jgi:hypothetical protein
MTEHEASFCCSVPWLLQVTCEERREPGGLTPGAIEEHRKEEGRKTEQWLECGGHQRLDQLKK